MIHLGIPVMDQQVLTAECLEHLATNTYTPSQLKVTIFDNASSSPYTPWDFTPFDVEIVRYEENHGYYRPLADLAAKATSADIVGLIHNDLFITEFGWDTRLRSEFLTRPRLGLVGFCGSDEVDDRGGRGGGTMCNFKGMVGQKTENTGRRTVNFAPALILDSLAMFFRQPIVQHLGINEHTVPCHFMDKVWPMRVLKAGAEVGVLGVECEHLGGQTAVGNAAYRDHALAWCLKEGVDPTPDPETAIYLHAENIWLTEGREDGLIPTTAVTRV